MKEKTKPKIREVEVFGAYYTYSARHGPSEQFEGYHETRGGALDVLEDMRNNPRRRNFEVRKVMLLEINGRYYEKYERKRLVNPNNIGRSRGDEMALDLGDGYVSIVSSVRVRKGR